MSHSPEPSWQKLLKFLGGVRTVFWVIGIIISVALYLLWELPLEVTIFIAGIFAAFLLAGIASSVFLSDDRLESLGGLVSHDKATLTTETNRREIGKITSREPRAIEGTARPNSLPAWIAARYYWPSIACQRDAGCMKSQATQMR